MRLRPANHKRGYCGRKQKNCTSYSRKFADRPPTNSSFVIRHSSFVIRHSSFVIRHSPMPYLYNTAEDQSAMLAAIGASTFDDLFAMVPAEMRLKRPLAIPPALTEIELTQHMAALAAKNEHAGSKVCFL